MNAVHNQKISQVIAVLVTFLIELLFAFLAGWTLYDVFTSWGFIPAIIIGGLTGLTLLLLYLYVFIFREYAIDAVKVFSAARKEAAGGRLAWAAFLALTCVLMDSFFNANRMIELPIHDPLAKFFIWAALQLMVFVPFALGKLVHAHINTVDVSRNRNASMVNMVDEALYNRMKSVVPSLTAGDLLQLKSGDVSPLQNKMNVADEQKAAAAAPPATDPLLAALNQWAATQSQNQSQPTSNGK